MSTASIDYDALAAQHGGSTGAVDYDALAAEHGGTSASKPGFWQGAKDMLSQQVAHPLQTAWDTATGPIKQILQAGPSYASMAGIPVPVPSGEHLQQGAGMVQQIAQNPAYAAGQMAVPAAEGAAVGASSAIGPMAARGIGRAALLGASPEDAYLGAMKASPALTMAQKTALAQTGINAGIPVSEGGAEKILDSIRKLDAAKWSEINKNPNAPIDANAVADVSRSRNYFAGQVNPASDVSAIDRVRQEFLERQGARPGVPPTPPQPTGLLDASGRPILDSGSPGQPPTPPRPLTASEAQTMKQTTGSINSKKYGQMGTAEVEAQKDIVHNIGQELAKQFPALVDNNAQEAALLRLNPYIQRAVSRIANHQRIGIGTAIAGTAAKTMTGSAAMGIAASVLKGVLDDPAVKSQLAITVSKAENIPYFLSLQRVSNYAGALAAASAQQTTAGNSNR